MQDAPQLAGQAVACPRCGAQFVVPTAAVPAATIPSAVDTTTAGEPFDPYYTWLGIPPSDQPANHYRLLGVQLFESNPSVIENAADRQMKHLQSFKIGAKAALSQRLLTEVSSARVQLLDPARKAAYDATLRSRTAPAAVPQLPQLPEGGTPFGSAAGAFDAASGANRSGMRRLTRRKNSTSFFASVWIIVGGSTGLAVGVLIIFYLTGQDFLGLSGRLRQSTAQADLTNVPRAEVQPTPSPDPQPPINSESTPSDPTASSPVAPSGRKPQAKSKAKPIGRMPPGKAAPTAIMEESPPAGATPPAVVELFAQAPRYLKLPPLASSAPEMWFNLAREPAEPLTFVLHSEAATLPAGANFRIQGDASGKAWNIELAGDSAGGNGKTAVGLIRNEGRDLSFAWSAPPADIEIRRQLANCVLEITSGNEFRNLQLREPLVVPPLAIDFDHEKQNVELSVNDTPASSKLLVKIEQLDGFSRGAKIRGDSDAVPFTRPIVIEFADLKGPEIEFRFVRQATGKLVVQVKPTFVEAANRKFDLNIPSLDKLTRAQEKNRAEAQDTLTRAQANLSAAQNTLQNLRNNPPSDTQSQISWNQRVAAATAAVKQLSGIIANATEKLGEAQARLGAVPEIRGLMEVHRVARVKFTIFARVGADQLVLVDGKGQ